MMFMAFIEEVLHDFIKHLKLYIMNLNAHSNHYQLSQIFPFISDAYDHLNFD